MCWRKSCEVVNELHVIDSTGAATLVIGGELLTFDDFMNYVDDEVFKMEEYLNHFRETEVIEECEGSEEVEMMFPVR
ncbi:hypothetical protein QE152_g15345 [Popillia japonica]|uniref:Uncharacterized protein n=1 Tax=Popillia japonica TaxID=7064 RepID=A0AAW1L8R4_POPJA